MDRGLEVSDDNLAEEAEAAELVADRIVAAGEPIGEVLVETPDVRMIVIREDGMSQPLIIFRTWG